MAFGDKLKELRAKHNITQQELGDIMGVSRATIAGYETKNKEPDFTCRVSKTKDDIFISVSTFPSILM